MNDREQFGHVKFILALESDLNQQWSSLMIVI